MARCYIQRTYSHHESVFCRIVKKSDDRHVQRTRPKHGRRSYLSVGIGSDSQSLLEWEPLRSKDRGLLSYNNYRYLPYRMHGNKVSKEVNNEVDIVEAPQIGYWAMLVCVFYK